eukprot:TRINITY_DN32898_c0_g1_i1.p1 TRINITY_DN32898_c0_g1~~TRINITY_DN32898_c0_g1_i1.p1  ORF type:complete len:498 (+),score=132.09 TRINITY_DN32898_c0_g1_i1:84-1577(+)
MAPTMPRQAARAKAALKQEIAATHGVMPYNFYPLYDVREVVELFPVGWVPKPSAGGGLQWKAIIRPAPIKVSSGLCLACLTWHETGRKEFIPWFRQKGTALWVEGRMLNPAESDIHVKEKNRGTMDVWGMPYRTNGVYEFIDKRPPNSRESPTFQFIALIRLGDLVSRQKRYEQFCSRMPRMRAADVAKRQNARMNDADDDGIEVVDENVAVRSKDGLTYTRINIPVRSVNCQHQQCHDFDVLFESLLGQSVPLKGRQCSICERPFSYAKELFIDTTFQAFLAKKQQEMGKDKFDRAGDFKIPLDTYNAYDAPPKRPTTQVVLHRPSGAVREVLSRDKDKLACRGLRAVLRGDALYVPTAKNMTLPAAECSDVPGKWEVLPARSAPVFVRQGRRPAPPPQRPNLPARVVKQARPIIPARGVTLRTNTNNTTASPNDKAAPPTRPKIPQVRPPSATRPVTVDNSRKRPRDVTAHPHRPAPALRSSRSSASSADFIVGE